MKSLQSFNYAVGALLQVGRLQTEHGPVTSAQIVRGCRFPPRFLYHILRQLVAGRVLRATAGHGGGYELAKPPSKITLWDIAKAVDAVADDLMLKPLARNHRQVVGRINAVLRRGTHKFRDELDQVTLADLIEEV